MAKYESFADSKRRKEEEYRERRRKEGKTDMDIPGSNAQLLRRVVTSYDEMRPFVEHHLAESKKKGERGEKYFLVLDTEGFTVDTRFTKRRDLPSTWSWHEQDLLSKKVGAGEMDHRRDLQKGFKKSYAKLTSARKGDEYWHRRREMKENGVLPGDVQGFSVAAVDDKEGEWCFAVHCQKFMENEGKGPELPAMIWDLLSHDNVVVINVSCHEDIDGLICSFGVDRIPVPRISYVEAQKFFSRAWGKDMSKRSLLSIVEEGMPGQTYYRAPSLTMSNWWDYPWKIGQVRYILNDVYFLARVIDSEFEKGISFNLEKITLSFPHREKRSDNQPLIDWSKLKQPEPEGPDPVQRAINEEVPVPAHRRIPEPERPSVEDWDAELATSTLVPSPLVVEEEDDEFVMHVESNVDRREFEVRSEVEPVVEEVESVSSGPRVEETTDEVAIQTPGPSDRALVIPSKKKKVGESSSGSRALVVPRRIEQYDAEVVDDDDEFMPQPKHQRVFTETVTYRCATFYPPPNTTVWPQQEPIQIVALNNKLKDKMWLCFRDLEKDLAAKSVEKYNEIHESVLPEFLAGVATVRSMNTHGKKAIQFVLGEIAPRWTINEKRRFLKAVGTKLKNLEFSN